MTTTLRTATIRKVLSWESQAPQYPSRGNPGIEHFLGRADNGEDVDCLLWRDHNGRLRGVLNYFAKDMPPYERKGNVNIFVHPKWRRRRVATDLLDAAFTRWPIDLQAQRYSQEGLAFVQAYEAMGGDDDDE